MIGREPNRQSLLIVAMGKGEGGDGDGGGDATPCKVMQFLHDAEISMICMGYTLGEGYTRTSGG